VFPRVVFQAGELLPKAASMIIPIIFDFYFGNMYFYEVQKMVPHSGDNLRRQAMLGVSDWVKVPIE